MSFDWYEYLKLARVLTATPISGVAQEACIRSGLSRAYYASYHHARNVAGKRHGFAPPATGVSVHKALCLHYRESPDPRWQAAGRELNKLRIIRVKADYDDLYLPAAELNPQQVALTLARTTRLRATLNSL